MIKEYGMSEKMGLVAFDQGGRQSLYGLSFEKEYSEETAREIDLEIKKIMDESFQRVEIILLEKKMILQRMAEKLIEKEVIEGDDLKKFLEELNKTTG